jgi:hypothetical protein
MGQDPPGWYYVGNGHLRYKFGDFWTDQYKTIGHSERAVPTASIESSDPVPAHTSPNVRLPHPRTPRVLIAVCAGLLGLGVGGGLLKPDVRHEWVSWAAAQASQLSALISRPAPPLPTTTPEAKVKADAKARADAKANAKASADARAKATPPGLVAPHAPAAKPKTKPAAPPAAPAHAATKPPVTPPSSPPRSTPRSVTSPR